MRNLKKLLAVVVAICVLATFTVPAFADTKTDAQIATDLGVIKGAGSGVTADYLATTPDRLQGAIMFLRLKGLEDTAKAFIGTDNFADVEGLNDTNQAILAYLKANPDLGFAGVGDNKFSPMTKMTAKEYTKVLLVALGYVYETDFTWANVMSFAASKGMIKNIDNETFTVNDLCVGTVEALKTAVKGGTATLISKLVDSGNIVSAAAVTSGIYTAVAKVPTVVSATADTLQYAKIVFSNEINSTTVTTSTIANSNITEVKLGADKKTVFVKVAARTQDQTLDITIDGVKDTSGLAVAKVVKTIAFRDVTIPVISGVVAKNAKTLVISASEPIAYDKTWEQPLSSVKIDGTAAFGKTSLDYTTNELTISLSTALSTGTHKINMADLVDTAGYKAVATEFNVDVAADTAAPVIASGKMNKLNELEVTFNEDLATTGDFYINGSSTKVVAPVASGAKVTLPVGYDLGIGSIVEIKVEYIGQKDVVGNEVKTKTAFTFKVADDTTLPTVAATIDTANKITLTFSKAMYATGTIKILKASDSSQMGNTMTVGTVAAGTVLAYKADTGSTVIEIAASVSGLTNTDPTDVKINITGMKDASVRTNVLADANLPVKLADTKAPTVGASYMATANATDVTKDYVTFYFSEAMDASTINSLANYVIEGATVTSGALSSFSDCSLKEVASDGMSASFYVPGIATAGGKYRGSTFTVYAVKDAVGNMTAKTSGIAVAPGNTFAALTATATDKRTLKVLFNQNLKTMDYTALQVMNGTTVVAYGTTGSFSTSLAAITMSADLPTSTAGLTVKYNSNSANIKDLLGEALVSTADIASIVDQIKPTVTVAAGATSGIELTFSENVNYAGDIAATTTIGALGIDLKVMKGADVVDLSAATITVYLNGAATTRNLTFNKIVIDGTGITAATAYTVSLYDNLIKDVSPATNKVVPFVGTAVTTK